MSNTIIQLKHSIASGNSPLALANGELAINSVDGKLFYAKPDGSIEFIEAFTGPSGLNQEIQFNDAGVLGSSANLKFDNTTKTLSTDNILIGTINVAPTIIASFNQANAAFDQANTANSTATSALTVAQEALDSAVALAIALG